MSHIPQTDSTVYPAVVPPDNQHEMENQDITTAEGDTWDWWNGAEEKAEDEVAEEIERKGPPPSFHHLFKLPKEIRDLIWEQVILEDNSTCWETTYLAVRQSCRPLYHESMLTFSKIAFFYVNPEKDLNYMSGDQPAHFTPELAYQVKNLVIGLTKVKVNKPWYPGHCWYHELLYLEDYEEVLGTLASQKDCPRNKCILEGEFEDQVFTLPDSLCNGLVCLQNFETVIFQGRWDWPHGNSEGNVIPDRPFHDFIGKLELTIGPAKCLANDPFDTRFEFHPR